MPWIFNSQSCEGFYRLVRSLTTVFARAANCSVKEILERIHKIQLLDDISNDSATVFIFPRRFNTKIKSNSKKVVLPTQTEIFEMIEKSKFKAIEKAIEVGLLDEEDGNLDLECDVHPLSPHRESRFIKNNTKKVKCDFNSNGLTLTNLMTISLKNYYYKFEGKEVEETSSYVEIHGSKNRMIVKKTSLIWLLRKDPCKLSSDRLERVKSAQSNPCSIGLAKTKSKKIKRVFHFSKLRK